MAVGLHGGDKIRAHLNGLAEKIGRGKQVDVGFLDGATYPDGTRVAMVAAVQEFGGSMKIPARTQELNFKVNSRTGESRFAKANKANFQQTVTIPEHIVKVPARPFFRQMIADKKSGWGETFGNLMKASNMDSSKALDLMGEGIDGQLKQSINDMTQPPLAPSTIARKGFDKPLIDTGHMRNSVAHEVKGK